MIKTCIVFVVGLILGVGAMTAYQWRQGSSGQPVSTADPGGRESGTSGSPALSSSSNSPGAVVALGSIDPHGGIVNVASPLVGHRVQKVNVAEGLLVNKGDLLIQLDASVDELELQLVETQLAEARQRQEAEIERAKQALSAAELAVRQIRESRELDLAVQNAKIGVLAAKSKQVATDLERLRKLRQLSDPLVADQQVEQQSVLLDVSRSEQQAGEVGVKKLQQSLDFQLQNAEAEQQAASRALRLAESGPGIRTLEQQLRLAQIKLEQTKIVAPTTGTVLSVTTHEGEVVAQSPLVRIADLDDIVCNVEVDATDVQRLQVGQEAIVASRAFRGPFPGTSVPGMIDRFGSVVAKAAIQPLDPRRPVDRHVVQVVVALESGEVLKKIYGADTPDATALVGLQVEVRFPDKASRSKASSP